jgi:serine protease inhibitor ecotin
MRMHQFMGSEMMKMERCRDAEMEKKNLSIFNGDLEMKRYKSGEKNLSIFNGDSEMQRLNS